MLTRCVHESSATTENPKRWGDAPGYDEEWPTAKIFIRFFRNLPHNTVGDWSSTFPLRRFLRKLPSEVSQLGAILNLNVLSDARHIVARNP